MAKKIFSRQEAEGLMSLDWYNDNALNNIIQKNYSPYMTTDIYSSVLDVGCGVGMTCPTLLKLFDFYTGIDNSPDMINIANIKYRLTKNVNFYNIDIEDYLENHTPNRPFTHILFKNVLQFIDADKVFDLLNFKYNNDLCCQIIQTVNKNNKNLFKLLHCFDFIERTRKFYTCPELIKMIKTNGFKILKKEEYMQTTLLDNWLNYHNVNKEQYYLTYQELKKLSIDELKKYNITLQNEKYYLTRNLAIIIFKIN